MLTSRAALATLPALAAAALLTACGGGSSAPATADPGSGRSWSDRPSIVVTYSVLGAVVKQVVGDAADVTILMPDGADPHEWSPSAKDVQAMLGADVLVDNGLELEGKLQDVLGRAADDGATVFTVADHVTVRTVRPGEGAEPDDPDQAPGAQDPHLWTDPLTMREWIQPFATALKGAGIDATAGAVRTGTELTDLDTRVREVLAAVPERRRKLVTGHESLGYFAARYGFQLVGAVVPAITSQAEASAGELAELARQVEAARVPAIFAEVGTPKATVEAVARDCGAQVVELSTHTLPADGTYRTFMLDLAGTVTKALA